MSCKQQTQCPNDEVHKAGSIPVEKGVSSVQSLLTVLEAQKKELVQLSKPFEDQLAEINKPLDELSDREEVLTDMILERMEEFGINEVQAPNIQITMETNDSLDSNWLKNYLSEHPDSFLAEYAKTTEYASFSPRHLSEKPPLQTLKSKVAKNKAIDEARELVEHGFISCDTETTGLDDDDEVVSVSVIGDGINYYSLVKPTVPIKPEAAAVHLITEAEVANAPTMDVVLQEMRNLIGDRRLTAYNARFDSKKLAVSAGTRNAEPLAGEWTCSMIMYERFAGMSSFSKLADASRSLGLDPDGMLHNAETDAKLAYELVKQIALQEKEVLDIPEWKAVQDKAYAEKRLVEIATEVGDLRERIAVVKKDNKQPVAEVKKAMGLALGELNKSFESNLEVAKSTVVKNKESVHGTDYSLKFVSRGSWDTKAIFEYMTKNPDSTFTKLTKGSWINSKNKLVLKKTK